MFVPLGIVLIAEYYKILMILVLYTWSSHLKFRRIVDKYSSNGGNFPVKRFAVTVESFHAAVEIFYLLSVVSKVSKNRV